MIKKILNTINPRHKISRQIGTLNVLMIMLMVVLIILTTIFYALQLEKELQSLELSLTEYNNLTEETSLQPIYDEFKLSGSSYIELLDSNLNVINTYKSEHTVGFVYSQGVFNQLVLEYDQYRTFHYLDNENILLIYSESGDYIVGQNTYLYYLKMYLITIVGITALLLFVFSKYMSYTILKPLQSIFNGVAEIRKGNYQSEINIKSKNELKGLRDSIYDMQNQIRTGIDLREQLEEDRKRLIMNISHDFKTPLTNICGYAQTLKENSDCNEESQRYLDIILTNGEKANKLMTDLFQLSRMTENVNQIHFKNDNICEFIRNIVIDYIPEFESKNIDYHFDIPETEISIAFSASHLGRALSNIIDNSIKYMADNPMIKIGVEDEDSHVKIYIDDNGKGIPKEMATDVFKPFVRTDSSRNTETGGLGLGLAITESIIKLHQGYVIIDPNQEKGTRFIIRLPKKAEQ